MSSGDKTARRPGSFRMLGLEARSAPQSTATERGYCIWSLCVAGQGVDRESEAVGLAACHLPITTPGAGIDT